jgi:hypothetical protein
MSLKFTSFASSGNDPLPRLSLVFCITIFAVCCQLLLFSAPHAQAASRAKAMPLYSCGDSYNNHCYGITSWWGNIDGSYTEVFTNEMKPGDIFVNNEMWLQHDGVVNGKNTAQYWVEVGTKADRGASFGHEILFWADQRPNGGGYANHFGYALAPQDFGKYVYLQIIRESASSCSYDVSATGLPVDSILGTSTNNCFNPNRQNIGMELAGSTGATAPRNGFINNRWYSYSNGGWHFQADTPSHYGQNPPVSSYWVKYPPGNNGGQWSTCLNSNC